MKQYKICYELDTGYDRYEDTAIVKADSKESAIEKLRSYVEKNGYYDDYVRQIFSVEEFTEDVFTGRFKPIKVKF